MPTKTYADTTLKVRSGTEIIDVNVRNGWVAFSSATAGDVDNDIQEARFSVDKEQLYLLDHDNEEYIVVDSETLTSLKNTVESVAATVSPMLESLPPEQRAKLEKFLGISPKKAVKRPTLTLKSRGSHEVAKLDCQLHQLLLQEQALGNVCLASLDHTIISNEDLATLMAAQSFFQSMSEVAGSLPFNLSQQVPDFSQLELNGLVIMAEYFDKDSEASDQTVSHFEVESVNSAKIEDITLPKNYHRKQIPMIDIGKR